MNECICSKHGLYKSATSLCFIYNGFEPQKYRTDMQIITAFINTPAEVNHQYKHYIHHE